MGANGALDKEKEFAWTKGPASGSPLPEEVMEYLNQVVLPYYFKLFDQEDDKEVIERVLEALRDIAERFGPGAFRDCMERHLKYVTQLLDKVAYCQTNQMEGEDDDDLEDVEDDAGEEDEDEEDDGIDHDEIILGNTSDFVLYLSRAYGNEFLPFF